MKQIKFAKSGYVSPTPGYSYAKNSNNLPKSIDLDGFSVQMLKPQFLQAKTLKKPLKQMDIHLKKTNPNGTRFQLPESATSISQLHLENRGSNKNIKINQKLNNNQETQNSSYQFISCSGLNIQPAKPPKQKQVEFSQSVQLQFKDKNSVISALFKKGQLKTSAPIEIKISKVEAPSQKVGPAQAKLKSLYKKDKMVNQQTSSKKLKEPKYENQQIDQEINQSISQQYANQSFQKMSGAYESQIKQSIRESIIGGSSGAIKESIHDQIPELIRSGQHSRIKQEVKEEISQSLPKQNIEQEVYEEIFQQASISDQALKSKNNSRYLKKGKQEDKFELSVSASKGFRTKTTNVVKSIKFAEELQIQKQIKSVDNKLQEKLAQGDKLAEQIIKQKSHFQKLQAKISSILNPQTIKIKRAGENKNLDLLHNFKIQVNRLITSENFMSKLRKLTAFLGSGPSSKVGDGITDLQDRLLNNLYQRIKDLRVSGVTQQQLTKTKKQYDEKLAYLLKQQQMSLKIQMDRKLHQKDMELKKMIAQLQQKMRTSAPISYIGGQPKIKSYGDKVEVDSDYSIDSDQVSWKMDLWEILPDYEKRKLYEKQGAQVAKFLTDILMNEIKDQNLDRSADISFEFPQQFNTSTQIPAKPNTFKMQNPVRQSKQGMMKPAFNRQQLLTEVKSKTVDKQYDFPPLPGVKKKTQDHSSSTYNIGFLQIAPKHQNQVRDTLSVSQVVKILSKYKNMFLKKKNDLIRKLVKTFQSKTKADQPLSSIINELRILNPDQNKSLGKDEPYVKAYEQELIFQLMAIFNRLKNRKNSAIEQEMKKMYDRLVVTCQIKAAEASIGNPIQIAPHQNYIDLKMAQQDKKVKDALVSQICNILALQFAKQMPKRK